MSRTPFPTHTSLGFEFQIDMRTVRRVLLKDGLDAKALQQPENVEKARALLAAYKSEHGKQSGSKSDPGPRQRKFEEEVKLLERKNRIEQRREDREYMLTSDVEKVIALGLQKLEVIPIKLASEFGLPEHQVKRVTELLDEARMAWGLELPEVNAQPISS